MISSSVDVFELVSDSISRYNMIPQGCRLGVAVSGGADSTMLLHMLWQLGHRPLTVLHVNHHLRGAESDADEARVRQMAQSLGLEFLSLDWHYEQQDNLEQAARDARKSWFLRLIKDDVIDRVATGHTKSDQAETVLFRLMRGTGPRGLAGVLATTREGLIRPLLDLERDQVENWLEGQGMDWREDATNRDTALVRNRIRHQLIPTLRDEWNPNIVEVLAQLAELSAAEEAYWQEEMNRLLPTIWKHTGTAFVAPVDAILRLPTAVQRRLIRAMIEQFKGHLRQIDFNHIESVLLLLNSVEGSGRVQVPGIDVFRSFDWVRFAEPGLDTLENRNYEIPLPISGSVDLPDGITTISTQLVEQEYVYTEGSTDLDLSSTGSSLMLRNWMPGDKYHPEGSSEEAKLKTLFQDFRIPLWERRHWPIICLGDQILWAEKFGVAKGYRALPGSQNVLKLSVMRRK